MISKESIARVRERADIVDEIGRRVALRNSGLHMLGLCPFHGEKTPSFSVNSVHQRYMCFGCGASGDVIEFLMQHDGSDFHETIEDLGSRLGVVIQQELVKDGAPAAPRLERSKEELLVAACEGAALYFQDQLQESEAAQAYKNMRALTPEVCDLYQIGYAPPHINGLAPAMYSHREDVLLEAGLLGKMAQGERAGQVFDRFRDRLMFPIRNTKGRVIGFGGRVISKNNPKAPKYLNSPETPLFAKHRVLYGLHEARASIMRNKQAFVVEGYMDVVAMAMHGIHNAVAAMGTALTEDHARVLLRFTRSICFLFDGDSAGQAAAWKSVRTVLPLLETGVSIGFLTLPDNLDPDEWLRLKGKMGFDSYLLSHKRSLSDFIFDSLLRKHEQSLAESPSGPETGPKLVSLESKANFAHEAFELCALVPSTNQLGALMRQEVARMTGVTGPLEAAGPVRALTPAPVYSKMVSVDQGGGVVPRQSGGRTWLSDEDFRAQRQAERATSGPKLGFPGQSLRLFRTPLDYQATIKTAPVVARLSIWDQIIQSAKAAPDVALHVGREVVYMLNVNDPQELEAIRVFDAIEGSEIDLVSPSSVQPDERQTAVDFLNGLVDVLKKHRRSQRQESLRLMKDQGEISEADYIAEILASPI